MSAAAEVGRIVEALIGPSPPLRLECWDGSTWGRPDAAVGLRVNTPVALTRLLWDPNELGLGRAYVAGDIEFEGSIFDVLSLPRGLTDRNADVDLGLDLRDVIRLAGAARRLGVIGRRPPPPPEESRLRGRLHSRRRDRGAISHHYDVSNDFYRLVLGPSMTYSCALFARSDATLEEAQDLKYEHVGRKLGLQPGMRMLDVGCGWGGMLLHAARHHGISGVGITLSAAQASLARARVRDAGLGDQVEIRIQDYRDIDDGPFDAVSSIGMFEHVGMKQVAAYFETINSLLAPGGRLLNHAISRPRGEGQLDPDTFVARFVFPDGELHEVGRTISCIQDLDLECRDVESLREHYARTLREWVRNLEDHWDEAVDLVGEARARIWRLYMAGSAVGFESARINVHQVLAVKPAADGTSSMPLTRADTPRSFMSELAQAHESRADAR